MDNFELVPLWIKYHISYYLDTILTSIGKKIGLLSLINYFNQSLVVNEMDINLNFLISHSLRILFCLVSHKLFYNYKCGPSTLVLSSPMYHVKRNLIHLPTYHKRLTSRHLYYFKSTHSSKFEHNW